ncbi:MAG: peptidoglycan-binding protein, partial [Oscillospiraceae bacterium]|nr:peptidoglycan-binding protein [Oscillospiraceae bacterium]
ELESQGQTFYAVNWQSPSNLSVGSRGQKVQQLQYMLRVAAQYIPSVPSVAVDGIFGQRTQNAVIAFQRWAGLTQDGIVGPDTWNALYNQVSGILGTSQAPTFQYPGSPIRLGDTDF